VHVEGARDVVLRDLRVSRTAAEFGPALTVRDSTDVRWYGLSADGVDELGFGDLVVDEERRELGPGGLV
jgi:hypothetical protein